MTVAGKSHDFWAPHVEELTRSDKTAIQYAGDNDLSYHALFWWKRRLASRPSTTAKSRKKKSSAAFVSAQLAAPIPHVQSFSLEPVATLRLGPAISLDLMQWPDVHWLAALNQATSGMR